MKDQPIRLRPARAARLVQHPEGVSAYPEPYRTPVLPPGWPPLEAPEEASVLQACDQFGDACRLRLRSLWDPASEFRVYSLEAEAWRGVCAATVFTADSSAVESGAGRNSRLLAIAHTPGEAARVAVDFLNWDLAADASHWRLSLTPAP